MKEHRRPCRTAVLRYPIGGPLRGVQPVTPTPVSGAATTAGGQTRDADAEYLLAFELATHLHATTGRPFDVDGLLADAHAQLA
ncbi:MAG: hypothetical protein ACKOJI_10105, partial [Phycisphaerales bacterium]